MTAENENIQRIDHDLMESGRGESNKSLHQRREEAKKEKQAEKIARSDDDDWL
jgi:hypothetical protein